MSEQYKEYPFNELVSKEIARAREKHGGKFNSHHEAYSIILEELDEYWEEVKKQSASRSKENMLIELVQIAAMARRTAEDILNVPKS